MLKLTYKETLDLMDKLNKNGFIYVGIQHIRSGNRDEVERQRDLLNELNVKPFLEVVIKPSEIERKLDNFVIVHIAGPYVNIYKVEDLKKKNLPDFNLFSKHKCIGVLTE